MYSQDKIMFNENTINNFEFAMFSRNFFDFGVKNHIENEKSLAYLGA